MPRPGQILRRAARTKIRKPNLPGDGGGHRFASTRRTTRSTSASAVAAAPGEEARSESDHTTESVPELASTSLSAPLVPPHAIEDEDWSSDRPLSYTDESTIFDAYAEAERRDSMTSVASDDVPLTPASHGTLDDPVHIPAAPISQPRHESSLEPEHSPPLHHPAPQRHLIVPADPAQPERTPSPGRSQTASPASSDQQHVSTAPGQSSQSQPPRKEKKGGLFGMGKKGKKDKDGEKDSGFFGSLFGSGRSKKPDEGANANAGFHGAGPAAAAALLGASKSKSPAPPQSPGPAVQPSANGTYARYPIHVERAVYRLSHIKLANPRRPLYEQVLISNLMFWYLGVINRAQQEEKEKQAEKEAQEKEKKEKRSLTKSASVGGGSAGGGQGGQSGRRAEMPVRGPQYEMQNRQVSLLTILLVYRVTLRSDPRF